ncbi:hypothetical protein Osc1_02620 [Hominimerdicola sp. 21CYCFAH17_S]
MSELWDLYDKYKNPLGKTHVRGETVDFKLVTPQELYAMAEQGEFLGYLYNRIKGVFPDILGEDLR